MNTPDLISLLRKHVEEIPSLIQIKEGFHNPHVKAWKTGLGDLLVEGGSACSKSLDLLKRMKNQVGSSELVSRHTYISHLETMERSLNTAIQTIQVFGRPEDKKDELPQWGKPKSQQRAVGHLMVGEDEIATDDITIHEVLDCLVSLAEDSNDLSTEMRDPLIKHLRAILDDELLQPFLTRNLDVLLGHWPEFQTK